MRINPNINANTIKKISTGKKSDKFGIDLEKCFDILKRNKKLDRFDKESVSKMSKIRKAFLKIAKLNKKRVIVISNNLSKKDVQTNVQNQVLKFINR